MKTNSNIYTFIYSSVLVVVVAAALAITNGALKERQAKNVEIDKMQQILKSLNVEATSQDADAVYRKTIIQSYLINNKGEVIDTSSFSTFNKEISKEVGKPASERALPVFEALIKGETKFVFPVYGAGLWGPIWGYIALNADKNTIFSVSFSHQGETPGLGAEISTDKFQHQFVGKHLFINGLFKSIAVLKPSDKIENSDRVDGISGGTITSHGVNNMLQNSLSAYESFLKDTEHEIQ